MNNFSVSAELIFSVATFIASCLATALVLRMNGRMDQKFADFRITLMEQLEKKFISERMVDYKIELATARLGPICKYPAIRERLHEQLETEINEP